MFVVLFTDFADLQEVYGPFDTKKAAHEWAFQHLPEVYRVFEMKPPTGADQVPASTKAQESN